MAQPRYRALAESLRADIAAGRYPVGSRLPSEEQLCESFSVSRHTVREALRSLSGEGIIERRQGAGTEVIAAEGPHRYRQSLASPDDLLQYAATTELRLERPRRIQISDRQAALLGIPAGQSWRRFRGLRTEPGIGAVICTTDVYLHADYAEIGLQSEAVYRQLERRYGLRIAEIEQDIAAVNLDSRTAALLSSTPDAPALRIVRRYHFQGHGPLEVAVSHHPGDRFTYASRLVAVATDR
tara:strand:- start:897 stop:1616 length:720 start_codon:yes stop_codon:yes gene_type:complete